MIIIGIVIYIIGFIFLINGNIFLVIIMSFIAPAFINIGIKQKAAADKAKIIQGKEFIGKDLVDIESLIGTHTSVNMANDNKRIYVWEDYLELLCDKDNICIEVLKNTFESK